MNTALHFSSKKQDWETPHDLFGALHSEFVFSLDVCASEHNTKCKRFLSENSIGIEWHEFGKVCWMNPPYGRGSKALGIPSQYDWVKKAYDESQEGCTVVCLLPGRPDTKLWHEFVMKAAEVRFIQGRVQFVGAKDVAPFPSVIVVFKPGDHDTKFSTWI